MHHGDRIDLDCGEQRASRLRKSTLECAIRPHGPHTAGSEPNTHFVTITAFTIRHSRSVHAQAHGPPRLHPHGGIDGPSTDPARGSSALMMTRGTQNIPSPDRFRLLIGRWNRPHDV